MVDGWRAVLGPDFPIDGPFDTRGRYSARRGAFRCRFPTTAIVRTRSGFPYANVPPSDLSAVVIGGAAASTESAPHL